MKLSPTTLIAGKKNVANWDTIRFDLNDFSNNNLWEDAFNNFFLARLYDRYLHPIKSIKQKDNYKGEGFAIMAIICSIIEFLEATYQGLNYRFVRKNDPPLSKYEYSKSSRIFIDFLTKRDPFKNDFNIQTADDFYKNVRCGLLHEARTNGKWIIRGFNSSKSVLNITNNEIVIFRNNFHDAIIDYVYNHYKAELLNSSDRKEAFLRKFDSLCNE